MVNVGIIPEFTDPRIFWSPGWGLKTRSHPRNIHKNHWEIIKQKYKHLKQPQKHLGKLSICGNYIHLSNFQRVKYHQIYTVTKSKTSPSSFLLTNSLDFLLPTFLHLGLGVGVPTLLTDSLLLSTPRRRWWWLVTGVLGRSGVDLNGSLKASSSWPATKM